MIIADLEQIAAREGVHLDVILTTDEVLALLVCILTTKAILDDTLERDRESVRRMRDALAVLEE